jgi:hypothetical protein
MAGAGRPPTLFVVQRRPATRPIKGCNSCTALTLRVVAVQPESSMQQFSAAAEKKKRYHALNTYNRFLSLGNLNNSFQY